MCVVKKKNLMFVKIKFCFVKIAVFNVQIIHSIFTFQPHFMLYYEITKSVNKL